MKATPKSTETRGKNRREYRCAALSCSHAPFTDWNAIREAARILREFRPTHLIHLGDLFEAAPGSVHPHELHHSLETEYRTGATVLAMLRQAAPNARRFWVLGNHEDNLRASDPRRIPEALRSLLDWNRSTYGDEFRRWTQIPYIKDASGTLRLGHFLFMHGWESGVRSDFTEAVQMVFAARMPTNSCIVRGHTHRVRDPERIPYGTSAVLDYWVANVGHTGPSKPAYMQRRNTTGWSRGLFLGITPVQWSPNGRWSASVIRLEGTRSGRVPLRYEG